MPEKPEKNVSEVIAEEYLSSLCDLKINTKPMITMLTMLAEESQEYGSAIVATIEKHIQQTTYKLPALYLIDSIVKNVGGEYKRLFAARIGNIFSIVFKQVDEKVRKKMYELRQTWNDIFPASRLFWLDTNISELDPAWPVTAQVKTAPQVQPNIHVNPKFKGSKTAEIFKAPPASSSSERKSKALIQNDKEELIKIHNQKIILEQEKKAVLDLMKETKIKGQTEPQGNSMIFVAPWKMKEFVKDASSCASPTSDKGETAAKIVVVSHHTKTKHPADTIVCKSFVDTTTTSRPAHKHNRQSRPRPHTRHSSHSSKGSTRDTRHDKRPSSKTRRKSHHHSPATSPVPPPPLPKDTAPSVDEVTPAQPDAPDVTEARPEREGTQVPQTNCQPDEVVGNALISATTAAAPLKELDVDLRLLAGNENSAAFGLVPSQPSSPQKIAPTGSTLSLFGKEDVDLRQQPFAGGQPLIAPPKPLEYPDSEDDIIFIATPKHVQTTNMFEVPSSYPHANCSAEKFFQAFLSQLKDDLRVGMMARADYNRIVQDIYNAKDRNQLAKFEVRTQLLRDVVAIRKLAVIPAPTPVPAAPFPTLLPPPLPPRLPGRNADSTTSVVADVPTTLPAFQVPPPFLDVHSLMEKLQNTGMIKENGAAKKHQPTAPKIAPPQPVVNNYKYLDTVPGVKTMFDAVHLRKRNNLVIRYMYNGLQCSSCGLRFPCDQQTLYSRHLDWHFRMNKKQQESTRKANSRKLYLTVEQWVQYEEVEETEQSGSSVFDLVPDANPVQVSELDTSMQLDLPSVIALPDNPSLSMCPVCFETFSHFYNHTKEEWQYKNAIHKDSKNFHPGCWEDYEHQQNDVTTHVADQSHDTDDELTTLQVQSIDESSCASVVPTLPSIISALLAGGGSNRATPVASPSPVPESCPDQEITLPDSPMAGEIPEPVSSVREASTTAAPPFQVKVEAPSMDDDMEIFVPPPMPRLLADLPLKIEIKQEPEDVPSCSDETFCQDNEDIVVWTNGTGTAATDLDGNSHHPVPAPLTDTPTSLPIIKINFGKNSALLAKKNSIEDEEEEEEEGDFAIPIPDDDDFCPPAFSFDVQTKPLFEGVQLQDTTMQFLGYEMSSLCSLM